MKKSHEIEAQWWPRIFEAAASVDLMHSGLLEAGVDLPLDRLIEVSYYLGGNENTDITLFSAHLWELVDAYLKERRF